MRFNLSRILKELIKKSFILIIARSSRLLLGRLKILRIREIPVMVDYGWIAFFCLVTWLFLWSFPASAESLILRIIAAILGSVLFFTSILLHELAHTFVAKREGIAVNEILLHPFGGLSVMSKEPDSPKQEFRIAIAGPLMSLMLSLTFLLLLLPAKVFDNLILMSTFAFLFFCNLFIALFNLLPGLPLDGGRILKAILWRNGKSPDTAINLASRVGQFIALSVVFAGIAFSLIRKDILAGLWISLVGVFLWIPATSFIKGRSNHNQVSIGQLVKHSMILSPDMLLAEFLNKILPLTSQLVFPVGEGGRLHGVFSLKDLRMLPESQWAGKRIRDLMRVVNPDYFISIDSSISEAGEQMKRNGLNIVVVLDKEGKIVGILDCLPDKLRYEHV